jgi:hypothetical protein
MLKEKGPDKLCSYADYQEVSIPHYLPFFGRFGSKGRSNSICPAPFALLQMDKLRRFHPLTPFCR